MHVALKVVKKIESTYEGVITGEMIRDVSNLPKNAKITFQVPGGGDWSNKNIEIDGEHTIGVTWTTTEGSYDHT